MAGGTRINKLQEGLNSLKKSNESQFCTIETEMMALKRQTKAVVQQIAALIVELQKHSTRQNMDWSSSSNPHVISL